MKKIVHVVSGINFGGVEAVLYNYFKNINLKEYKMILISHEKPNIENEKMFEKLGINIYQVTPKRENLLKNLKELYKIIKQEKPDIVHCHMTSSNYAALFIAKLLHIKTRISHSHLALPSKSIIEKIYCKLTCLFANKYIACSYEAGEYLYGKKNMDKVIIIKNAFDINKFCYDKKVRDRMRKKLGLDEKFIIGNIGRFEQQKNHIRLLEIFKQYVSENPNSVLLLIGNGSLEDIIKNKINELNLKGKVIILHNITNIEDYYQAMDLFLFPTLFEGLGIVLIEAQISGLPCITSTVVPKETKITDLISYVNLEQDNKIWINEIEKNSKYIRKSHNKEAEKFGYEIKNEVQNLLKLYEECVYEKRNN